MAPLTLPLKLCASRSGNVPIGLNMEVHKVVDTDLAYPQFLDRADAFDRESGRRDVFDDRPVGHAVHQVMNRRAQQEDAIEGNDNGGQQRGPVVGRFPAGAAPECDPDPDQSGGRGEGIATMVPGISLDGSAARLAAHAEHAPEQDLLDGDDGRDHHQCKRSGHVLRVS